MYHMETPAESRPISPSSETLTVNPAAIIVPRRHRDVLIEPPAAELAAFLAALPATTRLSPAPYADGGTSIETLAGVARQELIDAINRFAQETGFSPAPAGSSAKPWVITGHQVEFYHPGVWTKVILTHALANQSRAMAIDLLVDHDTVDHLGCALPQWNGSRLERKLVTWGDASALPAEFLSSPQGEQKAQWLHELQQFPLVQTDALRDFTQDLRQDSDADYVRWMSRARRNFEHSFGINVQHVPCSYICSGLAWHSFVLLWLRHARTWCTIYNSALDQYRIEQRIVNPGRPMPNLAVISQELELPFWIYAGNQPRHRLALYQDNGLYLQLGTQRINVTDLMSGELLTAAETLRGRLVAAALHVRPRALTLTMFVRLLLSDLFIHGIGGAMYDQMTDRVMDQLFGVHPAYACASAGWLLPVAGQINQGGANIPQLKWRQHHLKSNPELLVPPSSLTDQAAGAAKRRHDLISDIARSLAEDRRQHRRRGPHWLQRRAKFRDLHEINARLLTMFQPQVEAMNLQMHQAEATQNNVSVASWREYFIALHPRASLQELIAEIQSRVGP